MYNKQKPRVKGKGLLLLLAVGLLFAVVVYYSFTNVGKWLYGTKVSVQNTSIQDAKQADINGKVKGVTSENNTDSGSVLAVQDEVKPNSLVFRLPVYFFDLIHAASGKFDELLDVGTDLTVGNDVIVGNNLEVDGIIISEAGITAPNVIYSIIAGNGVSISGDQDITIANNDAGSAQQIIKNFEFDGNTISAGSNDDTLTFTPSGGITMSTSGNTVTISSEVPDYTLTGWIDGGTTVFNSTLSDNVGIGTSIATSKLHVVGTGNFTGGLSVLSGINNNSGGVTNAGSLTGVTGLTSSGTITFSNFSTGILHSNVNGVLSSSAINLAGGSNEVSGSLSVTNGGTGLTSLVTGDIVYASAVNTFSALGVGAEGQVLTINGGIPAWGSSGLGAPCATCIVNNPGSTQIINPSAATATGMVIKQAASGSVDVFRVESNDGTNTFFKIDSSGNVTLGSQTSSGVFTVSPASTDPISISPITQGSNQYTGTITSSDLTAARTWTFPDASGIICLANGNCSGTAAAVGGSGTTNYLSKWSSTYGLTNSLLYDNGTNIGIGTSSPTSKLHVVGTFLASGLSSLADIYSSGHATISGSLRVDQAVDFNSTFGVSGATTLGSTLGVTGQSTFGGNVGIGTTIPSNILDVRIPSYGVAYLGSSPPGGGAGSIVQLTHGSFDSSSAAFQIRGIDRDGGSRNIAFGAGTSNFSGVPSQLFLSANGNVGIGTTGPSSKLNITSLPFAQDVLRITDIDDSSSYFSIKENSHYYIDTSAGKRLYIESGANIALRPTYNLSMELGNNYNLIVENAEGDDIFHILESSGNVGIGTIIPVGRLDIQATTTNSVPFHIQSSDDDNLVQFAESSAGRARLQLADDVGSYRILLEPKSYSFLDVTALGVGDNAAPSSLFGVKGGATIGSSYYSTAAPTNGLIVEGNVGIGTSNPLNPLHVNSSSSASPVSFGFSAADSKVILRNVGGGLSWQFLNTSGLATEDAGIDASSLNLGRGNVRIVGSDSVTTSASIPARLQIKGSGSTSSTYGLLVQNSSDASILAVRDDGNIGIGTNAPASNLHVKDTARVVNDSGAGFIFDTTDGVNPSLSVFTGVHRFMLARRSDDSLRMSWYGGSDFLSFKSTGIGIGTTTVNGYLNVEGAAKGKSLAILNETGNQDIFTASASGVSKVTISRTGNVGIGTTSPVGLTQLYSNTEDQLIFTKDNAGEVSIHMGMGAGNQYSNGNFIIGSTNNAAAANRILEINPSSKFIGIGTNPSAVFHVLNTGEQLRLGYDASSYTRFISRSDGKMDIITNGTDPDLELSTANFGNALVIDDSTGYIGIGTEAPGNKLTIESSAASDTLATIYGSDTGYAAGYTLQSGSAGANWKILSQQTYMSNALLFGTSAPYAMALNTDGNLGVGTTVPNSRLNVKDNGFSGSDVLAIHADDHVPYLAGYYNDSYSTTTGLMRYFGHNDGTFYFVGANNERVNFSLGSYSDVKMSINESGVGIGYTDSGTAKLAISGGNIGVSTNSPQAGIDVITGAPQLRIGWNGSVGWTNSVASDGGLNVVSTGTDADYNIDLSGATDGDFSINTDDLFVDTSTGNIGIGTSSPAALLHIYGGNQIIQNPSVGAQLEFKGTYGMISSQTGDMYINAQGATSGLIFRAGGSSEKVRITGTGNLGIGTTSPIGKLNIEGAATGKALTILNETGDQNIISASASGSTVFNLDRSGNITWDIYGCSNRNCITPSARHTFWNYDIYAHNGGNIALNADGHVLLSPLGNVGIGTTIPGRKLEVIGHISIPNNNGLNSIYTYSADDENWRIGMNSSPGFTRSLATTHIQYITYGNSSTQGFAVGVNGGNSGFEIRGSDHQAYFRGNVGLGTTSPTQRLDVFGSARFSAVGSGTYSTDLNLTADGTLTTSSSDRRLKENVIQLKNDDVLSGILQLKPSSFIWKDGGTEDIGLIAQDVAQIFPEITFTNQVDGYMGINYSRLPALLVSAIQEQQLQLNSLNLQITADGLAQTLTATETADISVQPTLQDLISGNVNLSETVWTFIKEVVFTAKTKFLASVEFAKEVTINGSLRFSKENAGTVNISSGVTKVKVSFDKSFDQIPNIYITNKSILEGDIRVAQVEQDYFILELSKANTSDISVQWLAILAEQTNDDRVEVLEFDTVDSNQQPNPTPVVDEIVLEPIIEGTDSGVVLGATESGEVAN